MIAYEFYRLRAEEKGHFIGILPERRKNPKRVTEKSIMNWVQKVLGDYEDIKNIYFVQVEI